jgi:hypothetical protein
MGRHSTLLIVAGLLIAVGPALAAGFGGVMVRMYGRSGLADLLQWALILLVISIPLGAALVVSGGVMKFAQDRARRAAGIVDPIRLRDWLPHLLLGAFMVLAPGYLGIEIGGHSFSPWEAWLIGLSQFYVGIGLLLIVLALFVRAGARWVRWPLALWGPVFIFGLDLWTHHLHIGVFKIAEFGVGVFIALAWMWLHLRRI